MATSGSGIGTPITGGPAATVDTPAITATPAMPLHRYAAIVGHDEAAFWGVDRAGFEPNCSTIWTSFQREKVSHALRQAQHMMEGVLNFPLAPTWITSTIGDDPRLLDDQRGRLRLHTRWCMVAAPGVRAETAIGSGVDVGYGTEPATLTVSVGTATADEIEIRYPGTTYRIYPSSIGVTSGTATIRIPRSRLVSDHENDESGWNYADVTRFLSTVDVVRVYTDDSTNAIMRRPPSDCIAAATQSAQMYILDNRLGYVQIIPGNYVSSAWVRVSCATRYEFVGLNYRAGITALPYDYETMIVRLAHTLMPEQPCGCEKVAHLWRQDMTTPDVLTAERLNCPFGLSNGAWAAYTFCLQKRILRGMTL